MSYKIVYTKDSVKDLDKIRESKLKNKVAELTNILRSNPYQIPPKYEKFVGDLSGAYSRRINKKHRLVYQVYENEKIVKILSVWSHYEF